MFRGECPVGGIDITGYFIPAAQYCVITGGEYKTTGNDTGQKKGTCSFKNGRSCDASDYFAGKCGPDIWPMFGVSNQLLAAIALGIGTTIMIKAGKTRYAWTTFVPMVFMYLTTFSASWTLIGSFLDKAARAASVAETLTNAALVQGDGFLSL